MSDDSGSGRTRRWIVAALAVTGLLIVGGAFGVPWVIRRDLIANQAKCCEIAAAFDRERPGAGEGGPEEVGRCLQDIVDGLPSRVRGQLEEGQVEHSGGLRRPSEPLGARLLDLPMSADTVAAIDHCATARRSRFRGGDGLAVQGLLQRYTREAHLERDADERLRRLVIALELWVDVYAVFDQSITSPVLWAREIGQSSGEAIRELDLRAEAAERLRALAASLPDVETATAIFYCAVYGEVQALSITDAWEANEEFGASLAMAAGAEPAVWGTEPPKRRLDRAIPSGVMHEQFAEPGSAYVAGTLIIAAELLDPVGEYFLGEQPQGVEPDAPMRRRPCRQLVLPSALDGRELTLCNRDRESAYAGRELNRLFRALRETALEDPSRVPERIDDLEIRPSADDPDATERVPAEPLCEPVPRPAEALEAWAAAVGYAAPAQRRVTLTLLDPRRDPPAPLASATGGVGRAQQDGAWRVLRARWRLGRYPGLLRPVICDGPIWEARLWIADDFQAGELELGEVSEPAAESR